jgi:plasmid stabilization system protein ParE
VEIKWSNPALDQFDKALDFIITQGYASYAIELEDKILSRIENLVSNYNIYPVDKYKKYNDGTYHAFETDEYRISYRVQKTTIKIIRIRHTSRRTRMY